jgi:hypothetical protein
LAQPFILFDGQQDCHGLSMPSQLDRLSGFDGMYKCGKFVLGIDNSILLFHDTRPFSGYLKAWGIIAIFMAIVKRFFAGLQI